MHGWLDMDSCLDGWMNVRYRWMDGWMIDMDGWLGMDV